MVKFFQGGDLVPSISQQIMGGPDLISVVRDNIPSSANLSDDEILAWLDAISGMLGDNMMKLVTKARGGKIRSGIANPI